IIAHQFETRLIKLCQLDDTKIIAQYVDGSNLNYETALVGEVNGYSISWAATDYTLSNRNYPAYSGIDSLNTSKIVSVFDNENGFGTAVIGNISGTAISFGNEYTFNNAEIGGISVSAIDDDTFLIAYTTNPDKKPGMIVVGQVLGNTISYSEPYSFAENRTEAISVSARPDGSFIISYYNGIPTCNGYFLLGQVNGIEISIGEAVSFEPPDYNNVDKTSILWMNDDQILTVCGNTSGAIAGEFVTTYPLGIATTAGLAGDDVKVTFSGVVEGLSGLTTGLLYYSDESGNLTTTTTERYLGYALSATELYLQTEKPGEKTIKDGLITTPKLAGPDSEALTNGTAGQVLSSNGDGTLAWGKFMKIPPQSSEPATCDSSSAGSIATTSAYKICICNGTAWNDLVSGAACSW
ncbi:hypothetical protein MHK_000179, partial [Candidatus Magnetomorum sp. HK-1]